MNRKTIITLHLYCAAFFTPILLMMAISGTFYLFSIKGSVDKEIVYQGQLNGFDKSAKDMKGQITEFINSNNIQHEFEYVKGGGNTYFTRPTSEPHLVFKVKDGQLEVTKQSPDLIRKIIELHKGHGPTYFKHFQKVMGFGLMFILCTGFLLGLTSNNLRTKTLSISGSGAVLFLLLILI